MSEREVQHRIVNHLRAAGWLVKVLSIGRHAPGQHQGLPDVLAFRGDCTLLIECKAPGGALRDTQLDFRAAIEPHTGPHLRYLVLDTADARVLDAVFGEV